MDFFGWVGRFHPVVVHLPIGILIIGVIFQYLNRRRPHLNLGKATEVIYLFGFVSAAIAAIAGWLLAKEGGYQQDTIFWHRWVGIAMVFLAFGLWRWSKAPSLNHRLINWGGVALLIGLTWTGHLGGELTHGDEYLVEKAPDFIKKLVSYDDQRDQTVFDDPDSTYVYKDLIRPFLEEKCWTCHDDNLHKGGLVMSTREALLEGGRNGEVIETTAAESELFKRVVLDPSSRKYMPPKGTPLSYREIKLLEWWIDMGAPFDSTVSKVPATPLIQEILMQRHSLDTKPKSFLEKKKVDPVSEEDMAAIANAGFYIRPIAMTTNFVDVKWKNVDTLSLPEALPILEKAATQIAWLDLGHSEVTDDLLPTIGKLKNVIRLRLEDNPITDAGIQHLSTLQHLESLNLYKTKISDICASDLTPLKSLKRLYVWQTDFTEEGVKTLESELKNVEVVLGHQITATSK